MAFDDREYYREELAGKRGIRSGGWRGAPHPARKLPQIAPASTPLLDAIVANAMSQTPAVAPARPAPAEDETKPPAPVLVVDADLPSPHPVCTVWRRRWPWRWRVQHWQQRVRRWRGRVALAILAVAIAVLPPLMTPRCFGLVTWRNSPVECWRYSAAVLAKRIAANMAAMRDNRVM